MPIHVHHPKSKLSPPKIKLKCLVLGAVAAGKTSLLRRYFYKTFDEGTRVPTLGSDWFTALVNNPLSSENDDDTHKLLSISLQMWDTPGRERFDAEPRPQAESLGASFLSHADAIMLVYDMTSSTSFKQLLKWYADLMLLKESKPILVVANKLDLLQAEQERSPHNPRRKRVPQRNVLDLTDYRGKDYRYEYQVARIEESETHPKNHRRMEISSYLADRENWTTDWSYQHSLFVSEEGSHPDRDMVVLWCMRNGLKHMEVSAASGEGVDDAVKELITLALASKQSSSSSFDRPNETYVNVRRNEELDLHRRYGDKGDRCCYSLLRAMLRLCQK